MRSRKYFYVMIFCSVLFVASCSNSDKADTGSVPVSIPSDESIYETNPIDTESELINASDGRVARTSPDTLQINLENGEKILLKDENKYGDHPNEYIYKGFDKYLGHHLVELQFHEDYGVLAINAQDGTRQNLPSSPIYNPSKNMFVCVFEGNELLGTVIDIYDLEGFKNIFHEDPDWFIENVGSSGFRVGAPNI